MFILKNIHVESSSAIVSYEANLLNRYNSSAVQFSFRNNEIGPGESANDNINPASTGDITLGTDAYWAKSLGYNFGQHIEDLVGPVTIATAATLVSVTPFYAKFSSGGAELVLTVSSISRGVTGRINSGTQNGFYYGGTSANNFNFTSADVVSKTGTFSLLNGSWMTFQLQSIPEVERGTAIMSNQGPVSSGITDYAGVDIGGHYRYQWPSSADTGTALTDSDRGTNFRLEYGTDEIDVYYDGTMGSNYIFTSVQQATGPAFYFATLYSN